MTHSHLAPLSCMVSLLLAFAMIRNAYAGPHPYKRIPQRQGGEIKNPIALLIYSLSVIADSSEKRTNALGLFVKTSEED